MTDGTVTFKVAPDYEVDPTTYSFTVTADDNNGGTAVEPGDDERC